MDDLHFLSQVADELGSVHPATENISYNGEEPESLTLGQTQPLYPVLNNEDVFEREDLRHLVSALSYELHTSQSFTTPLILKYYTERKYKRKPPLKLLFPRAPGDTASLIVGPLDHSPPIVPLSKNEALFEVLIDRILLKHPSMTNEKAEVLAHKATVLLELLLEHVLHRDKAVRTLYGNCLNPNRLPLHDTLINHRSILSAASVILPENSKNNNLDAIKVKLDTLTNFNKHSNK